MFTNLERVLDKVDFKKIIEFIIFFFLLKKSHLLVICNLKQKICCHISIVKVNNIIYYDLLNDNGHISECICIRERKPSIQS